METKTCNWCGEEFEPSEMLFEKAMGWMCQHCFDGIVSRGEELEVVYNYED